MERVTEILSFHEFTVVGGKWLSSRLSSVYNTIYNSAGETIGYMFEYDGYRYSRINLNWEEEKGEMWHYSYIKEPL